MIQKILKKLKMEAEKQSVNELSCLEPETFMELLEIDRNETAEFINYLYNERLLLYRYKFKCLECGNDCIAYEKQLLKVSFPCGYCGKEYTYDNVCKFGHVVYELKKQELLEWSDERELDFTKESIKEKIVPFSTMIEGEKQEMKNRKKVFFGSSTESIDVMDDIAALVAELGCETLTWNSSGTFRLGDYTLESLLEVADQVDAAIFIFNADDKIWYRKLGEIGSVRDNVLFEYGLFIGKLTRKNVTFACKNKPHIASDLLGMTYLDADEDNAILKKRLRSWLEPL